MKSYPSIPQSTGQRFFSFDAHVFDKLDGQNFRSEWSRKRGWYKFGSRTQMVDETHEMFGPAVTSFQEVLADDLAKILVAERTQKAVVFTEWWGPSSFAGQHLEGEELAHTVIDLCLDQRGFVSPSAFRELLEGEVATPRFLGRHRWTRELVLAVRRGELPCTSEGVVGKSLEGPRLVMAKAKTQAWLDRVYALYDLETAQRIANS